MAPPLPQATLRGGNEKSRTKKQDEVKGCWIETEENWTRIVKVVSLYLHGIKLPLASLSCLDHFCCIITSVSKQKVHDDKKNIYKKNIIKKGSIW